MNRLGAFGRGGGVARMLGAVIAAAAVTAAHGQLVPGFYVLEGTQGVALSADGRFGGGTYETPTADFASRWTFGPGTSITRQDVQLPTPPHLTSYVTRMSADGSTLVGRLVSDIETVRPFRIGADGVVQNLGTIGSYQHVEARAVNEDGSVVVGYATQPETYLQGRSWRWTQATGMQLLPNPVGGIDATAVDMTPDGSVIAGYAYTFTTKAMVWRNGMAEFLGTVPGTPFGTSYAYAVSDDGNVVVGESNVPGGAHAVRWVGNEPEVLVTDAFAATSIATATNSDGSLIGGQAYPFGTGIRPYDAFLWSESMGVVFARDYFAARGVTVPAGYRLGGISGISVDESVFTGGLYTPSGHYTAFVVVVPAPSVMMLAVVGMPCVVIRRRRTFNLEA